MNAIAPTVNGRPPSAVRLSYKFQRLREQLRAAVTTGEFRGRLPGERELGRRYHANAKTVNKALCDLASEGLVIRQIGRGTFVSNGSSTAGEHVRSRAFVAAREPGAVPALHREALLERIEAALAGEGHRLISDADRGGGDPQAPAPASRRGAPWNEADGIVYVPAHPFADTGAAISDAQLIEILRRQIPLVIVGAAGEHAKVNAVVPDYSDAGFRVCEHLIRSGYESIFVVTGEAVGRQAELILSGARTAATRQGREVHHVVTAGHQNGHAAAWERLSKSKNSGVVCVGEAALQAALHSPLMHDGCARGGIGLAAILEPGSTAARSANITHYEVSLERLAALAARLLADWRPAHRPVEIVVPGVLAASTGNRGRRQTDSGRDHPATALAEASI